MKKLTFTLLSATLALSAQAQLSTYNYADAAGQVAGTVVLKTDTFHNLQVSGPGIPSFAAGNNVNWDLTDALYQNGYSELDYDTSTNVLFAPAVYNNEVTYDITSGLTYVSELNFNLSSNGIVSYGEHVEQQTYPLGLLTGNMADQLVLQTQDIVYSDSATTMPFPCVAGTTNWGAEMSYDMDMLLTYTAQGYTNQPIVRRSYISRMDTAVGYGTVTIMRPDGFPALPEEVIQVKSMMVVTDSFFSGGLPIPQVVLTTFNLTQGQESEVNQHTFYRAGEMTPFVNVSYDDNSFTSIHDITVHAQRTTINTNVNDIRKDDRVSIYPNPANSFVNISVKDKSISACHYELMNIGGQVVANGNVQLSGTDAQISLANTPAGMYFIRLSSNNEVIGESVISVIK